MSNPGPVPHVVTSSSGFSSDNHCKQHAVGIYFHAEYLCKQSAIAYSYCFGSFLPVDEFTLSEEANTGHGHPTSHDSNLPCLSDEL